MERGAMASVMARDGARGQRCREARPFITRGLAAALLLAALAAAGCGKKQIKPGDPLPGLTRGERDRFRRGGDVFKKVFTPETGLGPLFNSSSCAECHEDPAAGGFGDEVEVHATAFRQDRSCDPLTGEGGPVIQQKVTPALKAALGIDSEPFPKGATGRGMRSTPVLFGRGLLDAVPDSVILGYADPNDRNRDGIRGRAHRLADGRVGRFGRKASEPRLDAFNAGAFIIEMGVTNPLHPAEETIGGKPVPAGVDPARDPELTQEQLDLANDFVRFLAPPTPASQTKEARQGEKLFSRIGCAGCHIPALRTGDSPVSAIKKRTFFAYTDLLLHDMGADLADICFGNATPSDFRTEPLIGLRFLKTFLHDGRAKTLEAAIEAHGGEGARARDRFKGLSKRDRSALVAFLKSL
ncbi:MAG: hypothetical protein DMG07_15075 [Acidobacteria bacterium]|nr:MAG: hypothetical protein DMG07_15075 [Acidobacteriota bacterium]